MQRQFYFWGLKMKFRNPFSGLSKFELILWAVSSAVVVISFFTGDKSNPLTLFATLTGVTALIFLAKGDVTGQILSVVFAVLYGIISYEYHYYGEMITYLGMSGPIAAMSVVSWLRHPYKEDCSEVKINSLSKINAVIMIALTTLVTFIFYFILKAFNTENLIFSTISIATSFLASYLMFFRCSLYALAYCANDIVLIVLWVLATLENPGYLPMIFCFVMFFCNDLYGFYNWEKMKKNQFEN